jgi:hypothetical protein
LTRVYQFAVQEGFEWVLPVNDEDLNLFRGFDGTSKGESWTPVRVELLRKDEDGQQLAESDFPWLGAYAPVLRQRAIDALGELFAADGELLPLLCDSANLSVFNSLKVLDALDIERSEIVFFPDSDRIMQIRRYVFISARLRGVTMFKVPQLLSHSVYLTEATVKAVNRSKLTGVGFRLLWDETATGE